MKIKKNSQDRCLKLLSSEHSQWKGYLFFDVKLPVRLEVDGAFDLVDGVEPSLFFILLPVLLLLALELELFEVDQLPVLPVLLELEFELLELGLLVLLLELLLVLPELVLGLVELELLPELPLAAGVLLGVSAPFVVNEPVRSLVVGFFSSSFAGVVEVVDLLGLLVE
ncbi:MAG: hypothetical protein K0Q59_2475 [Paenibacillus sp.]|nr:hypothetical protein [Paenibacillus sp.]